MLTNMKHDNKFLSNHLYRHPLSFMQVPYMVGQNIKKNIYILFCTRLKHGMVGHFLSAFRVIFNTHKKVSLSLPTVNTG